MELRNGTALRIPARLRVKFDPEDLLQETELRIHKAGGNFEDRSEGERGSYFRMAMASTRIQLIRRFDRAKRRAEAERSLDAVLDQPGPHRDSGLAAEQTSPSGRARRNEQMERLGRAMDGLPQGQRAAIELHYIQGISVGETADRLGLTYAAVAGLLRRGLQGLRERLGEPIDR